MGLIPIPTLRKSEIFLYGVIEIKPLRGFFGAMRIVIFLLYELNEVRGMEFEVVFFYNLDKALQGDDREMMNRYLYVGISRATSHLAATLSGEEGNEDILKYFDRNVKDWQM
jgi:hypothetical protein